MAEFPEHDSDTPSVQVPMQAPVRMWVEAAATTLAVRTVPDSELSRPESGACTAYTVHAVRSPHGQVVTYAGARETWVEGDLIEVLVDASRPDAAAQRTTIERMTAAGIIGAACVRFPGNDIEPELAPGPSISAAWTIDGCVTSLFENHVRALLDLPLGSPRLLGRGIAACRVGAAPKMHLALRHCFARDPELRVHLYGTTMTWGMTMGHVTVVAEDVEDALRRARHAAEYLTGSIEE